MGPLDQEYEQKFGIRDPYYRWRALQQPEDESMLDTYNLAGDISEDTKNKDYQIADLVRERFPQIPGESDLDYSRRLAKDIDPNSHVNFADQKKLQYMQNAGADAVTQGNEIYLKSDRSPDKRIADLIHELSHSTDFVINPTAAEINGIADNQGASKHFLYGSGEPQDQGLESLVAQKFLENPVQYGIEHLYNANPKNSKINNLVANFPAAEDVVPYASQPIRIGPKTDSSSDDALMRRLWALEE